MKLANREEKSLRHVAMVATNRKRLLKSEIALFQSSSILFIFILICQMLVKFSGVESEKTVTKIRKIEFLYHVQLLHKAGA